MTRHTYRRYKSIDYESLLSMLDEDDPRRSMTGKQIFHKKIDLGKADTQNKPGGRFL